MHPDIHKSPSSNSESHDVVLTGIANGTNLIPVPLDFIQVGKYQLCVAMEKISFVNYYYRYHVNGPSIAEPSRFTVKVFITRDTYIEWLSFRYVIVSHLARNYIYTETMVQNISDTVYPGGYYIARNLMTTRNLTNYNHHLFITGFHLLNISSNIVSLNFTVAGLV